MISISVIIPIYQVENEISRCIESVCSQSFPNFELLLIDDGSLDGCSQICDKTVLEDEKTVVIHQRNSGVSVARNRGLSIACGEYVTVIDGDDWISPDYLEKLYDMCMEHDAEISVCDIVRVDERAQTLITSITKGEKVFSNFEAIQFYMNALFDNTNTQIRSPVAKLIKKEIVKKHLFPTDRVYAEDAACVYLWLWEAKRIVHFTYCGYYYYQNPKGICHKPVEEFYMGNFITEAEWIEFFQDNHFDKLYEKACKKYIFESAYACQKSASPTAEKLFRKVLRRGLRQYRKQLNMYLCTDEWVFEAAYPRMMKIYWFLQSLKRKK